MLSVGTHCRGSQVCRNRTQKGQCRHHGGTYHHNLIANPDPDTLLRDKIACSLLGHLAMRPRYHHEYTCKKSKIQEVLSLLLCYTAPCRAQTRFGLNEWRGA